MKIILLEEIPNLGVAGDIVDVKPGYANNYLLKKNRAIKGTKENLDRIEEIREEQAKIRAENQQQAQALADVLNETEIELKAKAGEGGKLFGSVTVRDILEALREQGIHLDKRKVLLEEPIRELGEKEVLIRTFPEIEAQLKVNVVPE